jgi:predicted nucleotidyltransferase component of viral defense system
VSSRWFEGSCSIHTYDLNELLGTKLRALYQRRQGRDLFDMATAIKHPDADPKRIIEAFEKYMEHGGHKVTRAEFEKNFSLKMQDSEFLADISDLLSEGYEWDPKAEASEVSSRLIELLPGEPWKGEQKTS